MKTNIKITELLDDVCLDEMGLDLEPGPVTAGQVMDDLQRRGLFTAPPVRKRRRGLRTFARAAIAAAMVLALSVTAYAVANYTDFFATVFGGEDTGDVTYSMRVDSWDEDGSQKAVDIVMENQPVDQDAAQALLGDKVTGGLSVTVGDYTCTVEDLVMAENGVGVMTYSIENPNGLPEIHVLGETVKNFDLGGSETDAWATGVEGLRVCMPLLSTPDAPTLNGLQLPSVDSIDFLVTSTDTKLEARSCIAFFTDGTCPEELYVDFFGDYDAPSAYCITVPLTELAEAVEFTPAEGWTASISPMGLTLTAPTPEDIDGGKAVTVHLADGSEYAVTRDMYVNNCPVSCATDGGTARYVFNRLIDPAEVTSVTVRSDAADRPLDLTFTK